MNDYLSLIVSKFGNDYIKDNNSDEIRYNCPFCMKKRGKLDTDHKLYANIKKGKFYCFKCGSKGRVFQKELSSSYGVYNHLVVYKGYKESDSSISTEDDSNMFYMQCIDIPSKSIAREYLNSRGISNDTIEFYNIKLGIDEFFGRVMIPNIVYGNNWTDMYSCRTYINQEPKYKNPIGSKKTNAVFNLHNISEGSDIYVNEGAITAICAGRNAVATYGCHPSNHQINAILEKRPNNLYCTLDGDEAGRLPNEELARIFCEKMKYNGNVYLVHMPKDKDAADMGEKYYKEYVNDNKILYYSKTYSSIISYFRK